MDQETELPIRHTGNSWSTNQDTPPTHSEHIQSASQRSTLFPSTKLESTIRIKFVAEMLQGVGLQARRCVLVPNGSWDKDHKMSIVQIRTKQQL